MCTPNADKAIGFDTCNQRLQECETLFELTEMQASGLY